MHTWSWFLLLAAASSVGCGARHPASAEPPSLTPAQAAAVESGVQAFARDVARDVTRDGPSAWRKHFADTPSFFMAVDGRMVFPNSASATTGIQAAAGAFKQIDLQWGNDLRVDPLAASLAVMAASYHEIRVDAAGAREDETGFFTGTAEYGATPSGPRWQFRNVHWSAAVSQPVPPRPAH
jgi:hypothetical protein